MLLIGTPEPGVSVTPPAFYAAIAKEFALPYEEAAIGEVLQDASLKSDPIHPNARGYRVIAERVAERLQQERSHLSRSRSSGRSTSHIVAQRAPAVAEPLQPVHGVGVDALAAPVDAGKKIRRGAARADQHVAAVLAPGRAPPRQRPRSRRAARAQVRRPQRGAVAADQDRAAWRAAGAWCMRSPRSLPRCTRSRTPSRLA